MTAIDRIIALPPGVVSLPTAASNEASWQEVNLLRWENGRVCPVGGWERFNYTTPASRIRVIHAWISNSGQQHIAYLCEAHLYVDTGDGVLLDCTPVGGIEAPGDDLTEGGFGDDDYGELEFGTPRPDQEVERIIGPAFTLGNWGEDLLALTSPDGRLLRWSPSTPSDEAEVVPNAPTGNRTFVVTPERHVILFGMEGEMNRWGWCDQEDIEDWDFGNVASKAGEYTVTPASPIVSASIVPGGVIYHTAKKTYIVRPVGLPFIYSYEEIADVTTPVSAQAIVQANNKLVWLNIGGFYEFNGASVDKVFCPIWTWVVDHIDWFVARSQAASVHMLERSEVWFFFPGIGETQNSHYVMWDYGQGAWAMGKMSRTCGAGATYTTYPILSDGEKVFKHESGTSYEGVTEGPWGETFTINIAGGAGLTTFSQLLPDIEGNTSPLRFSLKYKIPRSDKGVEQQSPLQSMRNNGKVDFRSTGRDFRLRIEMDPVEGTFWTMGKSIISIIPRGKK